jgi:hypothetical protein
MVNWRGSAAIPDYSIHRWIHASYYPILRHDCTDEGGLPLLRAEGASENSNSCPDVLELNESHVCLWGIAEIF